MNLLDIRKKLFRYPVLFVSALVVPCALAAYLIRKPKVDELHEEVGQLDRQWKQILANRDRSPNLETDVDALFAGVESIESRLMLDEQVAANYEFFYGLEAQAGVRLRNFSKAELMNGEGMLSNRGRLKHYMAIPFNLGVEGEFSRILQFVDLLQSQNFLIHIERVGVAAPTGAGDPSQLSATIRCYVLAKKP